MAVLHILMIEPSYCPSEIEYRNSFAIKTCISENILYFCIHIMQYIFKKQENRSIFFTCIKYIEVSKLGDRQMKNFCRFISDYLSWKCKY